jgi:hypothetical protein
MRSLLTSLCLVLAAISLMPQTSRAEARQGEVVVDRVLVVLGIAGTESEDLRIVTAFELEVEARLVLAERSRSVELASSDIDERFLNAVLEGIVNQYLLVDEAMRLQLVAPEEGQLAAKREELETRLGGPGALARFSDITRAPSELIDQIIRRRFMAEEFVLQNIQLAFSVTDAELREAHEQGDHPFTNQAFEEIRGQLEAVILARRQRRRLEEWLDEARRRSRVRRIDP